MNTHEKIEFITGWLDSYLEQSKLNGFVIGISGGIDSSVVSTLCAKTGRKTHILKLPLHSSGNLSNVHCNWLINKYPTVIEETYDLTQSYDNFINLFPYHEIRNTLTEINTKSRFRMITLYTYASWKNCLVVGTGNKIEDFGVGFFTKYGDGGVDISPIADLYKSEVYELGRELGISNDILNAPPSDGLWLDGRTDEQQIGATYDELENIMKKINLIDEQTYHRLTDREKEVLKIYTENKNKNMHKMIPIPVCTFPKQKR